MRLHASCVAFPSGGILLEGPSGSGKSTTALALILHHGARLVSDDQTLLFARQGQLWATAPVDGTSVLEVRSVGLIQLPSLPGVPLAAGITLTTTPTERLPSAQTRSILGVRLPWFVLPAKDPALPLQAYTAMQIAVGAWARLPV